jgi:putative flippase GtrA
VISKIRALANNSAWVERLRFLIVGGVNTVFGYAFSLTFYYQVEGAIPTLLILAINTLVSITFSFVLYKVFVLELKEIGSQSTCALMWFMVQVPVLE